jgi:hypothetical protein
MSRQRTFFGVAVAAWLSAFCVAGCGGYFTPSNPYQMRFGIDGYADRYMRYHASFVLDCPPAELTRDDLGRLPHSEWYRHIYSGCGQHLHYWTDCTRGGCGWAVGLEERASVDFDCPAESIDLRGVSDIFRATGCGQTAVYQREDEEWIISSVGVRRTEVESGTTVPVPPATTTVGGAGT